MRRRQFIGLLGAAAAGPRLAFGQSPTHPLVAVLSPQSAAASAANIDALRDGLHELGFVEGRNLALMFRFADGVPQRLPALAAELVGQKPVALVVGSLPAIRAAKDATHTIPIIMSAIVQDPMAAGLAASMAQPGGNVSGLWSEGDGGLMGKRLELLKDAVPGVKRVAVLLHLNDPDLHAILAALPGTAQRLGVQLSVYEVRSDDDVEQPLARARQDSMQALYVSQTPFFYARRQQVAAMALRARLPSVSGYREFAAAGVLLSYAANLPDIYRRAAAFVDKVIKGSNIGELPIERAVRFELVVNLKTAKALGLAVPESFLVRADEVIE
jgi:putative tryptophan/tyrosine transport system substrate-binding protein